MNTMSGVCLWLPWLLRSSGFSPIRSSEGFLQNLMSQFDGQDVLVNGFSGLCNVTWGSESGTLDDRPEGRGSLLF